MTRKLEETFNLPPVEDISEEELDAIEAEELEGQEEELDIEEMSTAIAEADKIDQALAPVRNLELLDNDMDDYADRAMRAFEDLMDLGQNVEDRHAATIFDSASKMMANALTAKTAKMDKKLKVIQMQMQKQKLELEEKKLKFQIAKDKRQNTDDDGNTLEGEGEVIIDRNELLRSVLDNMKKDEE